MASALRSVSRRLLSSTGAMAMPQAEVVEAGRSTFQPIANVWCIGRNYAAHAKELGNSVPTEEPVLFLKSSSSVSQLTGGNTLAALEAGSPIAAEEIHYEAELVLLIGEHVPRGSLAAGDELRCLRAVGLGLDLTRRGKQTELKKAGLPWSVSKAFEGSAALTPFLPASVLTNADLPNISFELAINETVKQIGKVDHMIFDIPFQLRYVNQLVPLLPGDLLFTGTPEGVGPIRRGDNVRMRFLSPESLSHLQVLAPV